MPHTMAPMVRTAKPKPFLDVTEIDSLLDSSAPDTLNCPIDGSTGGYRSIYRTLLPESIFRIAQGSNGRYYGQERILNFDYLCVFREVATEKRATGNTRKSSEFVVPRIISADAHGPKESTRRTD